MALSNRERLIGIGAVAAIALFGLDQLVWSPYDAHMHVLATQLEAAKADKSVADALFQRENRDKIIWAALQQGGLEMNDSEAQRQALHAVNAWADQSGAHHVSLKAERTSQEAGFEVITIDMTADVSMRTLSKLLWSLETAKIPLRLNEVRIKPRKDDSDDLAVSVNVSALCKPPELEKNQKASAGNGALPGEGS